MPPPARRTRLIVKVLIAGLLIAALAYLLHPASGYFDITVNGHHLQGPFGGIAALPMALGILVLCGLLSLLIAFGVGMIFLWLFALVVAVGIVMAAPFLLPVLGLVLIVYFVARL